MRLLLAEDEKEMAHALEAVFTHNHYSVNVVYNGIDAADWAESGNYDGIILDIMMPGKSGLEVLSELRKKGNNVPVLLLTAKGEIEDRVTGLDLGADDYLTKPFAMKEDADCKSGSTDFRGAIHGENLGIRQRCGDECRVGLYFLSAQKTPDPAGPGKRTVHLEQLSVFRGNPI